MKIEKISDNQIRCTLTKEDLISRELKLSELAYGTEKVESLFRDMIQQASFEFGFEVGDIPIMIEAIPISTESLVLVITKVEDPEELDTRFSSFTSMKATDISDDYDKEMYADEIISHIEDMEKGASSKDDINELSELIDIDEAKSDKKSIKEKTIQANLIRIYSFKNLDEVINLSKVLYGFYIGKNSLYKNPNTLEYYLVLSKSSHSPEEFNKVCNMASEYGRTFKSTYATKSYLNEHFDIIIKNDAINILSVI